MKKLLTLLLLGITFNASSQGTQPYGRVSTNLDVSNINPKIRTRGDAFWDLAGNPGFEVPRGSGKHTIFAGALWIGGKDQQNNLYLAAEAYKGLCYWPGPIATVQDSLHSVRYDKLWKVSKAEIQTHIANYNQPGYTMPDAIATWPGNGDTAKGEAPQLAPFVDLNNDGIYSPNQGDHPKIKGDQAIYLILNDNGNTKAPFTPPMNAEVHVMHYGYDNPVPSAVFHTLFTEYRIINRGTVNFQDFYAGVWTDTDIGYYNDDFIGCDTTQNFYYGYNGDNFDGDTIIDPFGVPHIAIGYGLNPPAQTVIFLDKKMSRFVYYNNDRNPINGNPDIASDFYNYMAGKWRNGNQLTYGGDGTNPANPPTNFMFPGNPISQNGWSERNNLTSSGTNIPADRRGVGSIGPYTLNAGQELKFTVAYTFSQGLSNLNSLVTAVQDVQAVRSFFNNNIVNATKPEKIKQPLALFPNPANDMLHIQLPATFQNQKASLTITDQTSRTVLQTLANQNQPINISGLSKGIYQVTVTSEKQILTSKLVKL